MELIDVVAIYGIVVLTFYLIIGGIGLYALYKFIKFFKSCQEHLDNLLKLTPGEMIQISKQNKGEDAGETLAKELRKNLERNNDNE